MANFTVNRTDTTSISVEAESYVIRDGFVTFLTWTGASDRPVMSIKAELVDYVAQNGVASEE